MIKIENLTVKVENKIVLENINLEVKQGEIITIFGPNGAGKSSLLSTIMGFPDYKIIKGRIIFEGRDITSYSVEERAKLGIFLAFQNPPSIRGLIVKNFFDRLGIDENVLEKVGLDKSFLERELNVDFSGGERKKFEIAQIFGLKPKLLLLDEIDSGIDLESLKLIGKSLNNFIKKNKIASIIVTHHGEILNYVKSKKSYVMINGKIICSGKPEKILMHIRKWGYKKCISEK